MPDEYSKKAPRQIRKAFPQDCRVSLADPLPGLTAAEHPAEGTALNPHRIRSLHCDRGVVIPAAVRIVNPASPFVVRGPHVDEDFVPGLHGISAQIGAARLDADISLVSFGGP